VEWRRDVMPKNKDSQMKSVHSLTTLAAAAILTGCASMPAPSETEGGLLAFPMHPDNNTGQPYSFYYSFNVYEKDTDIEVTTIDVKMSSGDYVDTYGPLPEGDYYLGTFQTQVNRSDNVRYTFDSKPYPINIPFSIEEDTVTLLNAMMWVQIRVADDTKGWTTSRDIVALTDAVKDEALAELESKNQDLGWSITVQQ